MTIQYKGHKFDCEYIYHPVVSSGDYDVPDDPAEIEITKVTIHRGEDDISELLADVDWLPEIERLIADEL